MKIIHPNILNDLAKVVDVDNLLNSEDKIENANLDNIDISGRRLKSVIIQESLVNKTNFMNTNIERFEVSDCTFKDCDFTASSLATSSWHVVEIVNARCTGLQLQNSTLRNVMFKGCKIELVNLRFAKLENIIFQDCMINDIDFYNSTLKNVEFAGCNIENISFSGAKLKNVDLTRSQIISVRGVGGLKGSTINYEQLIILAPYFALEFGIIIKD